MRTTSTVRMIGRGIAAAVVTGVLSAVVTRALMAAVEVLTDGAPRFDLLGSFMIVAAYVVLLLPGCIALAMSRARWPWAIFAAGCGVLFVQAIAIGLQETPNTAGMTALRWVGLIVVLLAMAATYAAQFALAARWSRHGLPLPGGAPSPTFRPAS